MIATTPTHPTRPITILGKFVNFWALENTNPILHPDVTVSQTFAYMKKIVRRYHRDMSKIAGKL